MPSQSAFCDIFRCLETGFVLTADMAKGTGKSALQRAACSRVTESPVTVTGYVHWSLAWLWQENTQQGGVLQLTIPGTVHPGSKRLKQLATLRADILRKQRDIRAQLLSPLSSA